MNFRLQSVGAMADSGKRPEKNRNNREVLTAFVLFEAPEKHKSTKKIPEIDKNDKSQKR